MKTYKDVAEEIGLVGITKIRFISYMEARWKDTEEFKCQDGYALEWANRFKNGVEYDCSDSEGKKILDE